VALVDVVETKRVIERLDHYGVTSRSTTSDRLLLAVLPRPLAPDDHQDRPVVCQPSKASIYNDTLLEAIISLGHKLT